MDLEKCFDRLDLRGLRALRSRVYPSWTGNLLMLGFKLLP